MGSVCRDLRSAVVRHGTRASLAAIVGVAAFLVAASLLGPGPATAASSRVARAELRQLLDQVVAAGAPGAAARIVDEHGVTQAASGVADQETGRRMRPGLHYRVGSVTKSYVATLVLQLAGESRLSLDDAVEHLLPGVLPYGDRVTVRQLLNHTSGVPEYTLVPIARLYTDPQERLRSWSPAELVALVANQPPSFASGTAWSYSNTDYVLAGMIVEAVTGHGLDDELQRRIVKPLGLRGTSFPVDRSTIPKPYAGGYGFPFGSDRPPLTDFTVINPSVAWAAGALVSDLADVQRFFRALLRGRLLTPAMLAEMTTPVPTDRGFGYGLGLIVIDTPSGRVLGHDGSIPGFLNVVLSTEDGRRQVGLMMNAQFAPPALSAAFDQTLTTLDARVFGSTADTP